MKFQNICGHSSRKKPNSARDHISGPCVDKTIQKPSTALLVSAGTTTSRIPQCSPAPDNLHKLRLGAFGHICRLQPGTQAHYFAGLTKSPQPHRWRSLDRDATCPAMQATYASCFGRERHLPHSGVFIHHAVLAVFLSEATVEEGTEYVRPCLVFLA